jgi:CDP-paratose 2-epimerase
MKIFISGVCGFAGSIIAKRLLELGDHLEVFGMDNLMRPGSELNRRLEHVKIFHGDLRMPSDLEMLPKADWVIDAAANPSVLAGLDGSSSSQRLVEHNLNGSIHLLEYCKRVGAGFVLPSTSRVYSISALAGLPMEVSGLRFVPSQVLATCSQQGVTEEFSTAAPVSLYGATKLASEVMALEYGAAFQFPVYINRCGVMAGAGQFGTVEQGVFSYWIHSWSTGRPLRYIGFEGKGYQVRDAFHPQDLADLVWSQIKGGGQSGGLWNVAGGLSNSMSLAELSHWCEQRFGKREVQPDPQPRPYDLPWVVLDSAKVEKDWGWRPSRSLLSILEEIADHTQTNPGWLNVVS